MIDKCPFLAAQEDARGWTVPPDNVEEMHKEPCLHCKVIDLEDRLNAVLKANHTQGTWINELEDKVKYLENRDIWTPLVEFRKLLIKADLDEEIEIVTKGAQYKIGPDGAHGEITFEVPVETEIRSPNGNKDGFVQVIHTFEVQYHRDALKTIAYVHSDKKRTTITNPDFFQEFIRACLSRIDIADGLMDHYPGDSQ